MNNRYSDKQYKFFTFRGKQSFPYSATKHYTYCREINPKMIGLTREQPESDTGLYPQPECSQKEFLKSLLLYHIPGTPRPQRFSLDQHISNSWYSFKFLTNAILNKAVLILNSDRVEEICYLTLLRK